MSTRAARIEGRETPSDQSTTLKNLSVATLVDGIAPLLEGNVEVLCRRVDQRRIGRGCRIARR